MLVETLTVIAAAGFVEITGAADGATRAIALDIEAFVRGESTFVETRATAGELLAVRRSLTGWLDAGKGALARTTVAGFVPRDGLLLLRLCAASRGKGLDSFRTGGA